MAAPVFVILGGCAACIARRRRQIGWDVGRWGDTDEQGDTINGACPTSIAFFGRKGERWGRGQQAGRRADGRTRIVRGRESEWESGRLSEGRRPADRGATWMPLVVVVVVVCWKRKKPKWQRCGYWGCLSDSFIHGRAGALVQKESLLADGRKERTCREERRRSREGAMLRRKKVVSDEDEERAALRLLVPGRVGRDEKSRQSSSPARNRTQASSSTVFKQAALAADWFKL
ncbi:uncharacterized protein SPSK_02740 [Sporothrix schenckii 1099-18]|uniref:Uncharacterized protein n=1 Tax=Sporothrix schenckii 1099-18 TaxID=1397361 RepID=A0A0F2MAC1_SPOSC|nr:uncharacterized protein SPSK_02740 [Sporothrix schenckii 1099-18]KJR86587.1 hypothetical protein SPSK_02740 [Sporothrix schenckii 1099-18]